MEWSLVLASQGIEPVINRDPHTQQLELLVPAGEFASALRHLRHYRTENPTWPWQQPVLNHTLLFDWGSLVWVGIIAVFFAISEAEPAIKSAGRMDGSLLLEGEWWRPFTATWLHSDAAHLASNLSIGFPLLGLAMGRHGTGIAAAAACLAGALGNLFATALAPQPHLSLGASGVVMACLGLITSQSWPHLIRHGHKIRQAAAGLFAGAMLFVLLGLSPNSDVLAHLGGFIAGLAIGTPLSHTPALAENRGANLLAGLVAALLTLIPWWMAFQSLSH